MKTGCNNVRWAANIVHGCQQCCSSPHLADSSSTTLYYIVDNYMNCMGSTALLHLEHRKMYGHEIGHLNWLPTHALGGLMAMSDAFSIYNQNKHFYSEMV
jgi:hypothetical protein